MSRIENLFNDYESQGKGGIIVEIPMLSPIPETQLNIASLLVEAGIDVIQLAVPYRFPWMQGPRIQRIMKQAAEEGIDYKQSFSTFGKLVEAYPDQIFMPVGFYGGLRKMGEDNYISELKKLNIDIVDVPDYPVVHDNDPLGFYQKLRNNGIDFVNCISVDLALSEEGSKAYKDFVEVVKKSYGFCFLIATKGGKTGEVDDFPYEKLLKAKNSIKKVQEQYNRPCPIVAVCGISTPQQVHKMVHELGLHVMFGSALFTRMVNGESNEEILKFLKEMKAAAL
ncbi:MAG: tryptophan synthase subunit alpha [Erysipelotrichaceae bacterium]|jgi:tryptophan synthase alpha chain